MGKSETDRAEFERLIHLFSAEVDHRYGARSTLQLNEDGEDFSGKLRLDGVYGQYATLEWNSQLEWTVASRSEQFRWDTSGTFPAKDFGTHLLMAASNVRQFPPTAAPKASAAMRFALGAIPVAAIILLVRVLAITYNEEDHGGWASTAQQVLTGFSFDDWFNLALGTVLANVVPAALCAAVISWLMYCRTTGGYVFEHDGINWRTSLVMLVGFGAYAAALLLADWWLKAVIVLLGALLFYTERAANPIIDLRKGRRIGSYFANRGVDGRDFILHDPENGVDERHSARSAGEFLREESDALLVDLHERRAKALADEAFQSRWTRVSTLADVLREFRAEEQSAWRARLVNARARIDGWVLEQRVLNGMLVATLLVAVPAVFVMVSPTPWMPAVCLSDEHGEVSVFPISGSPEAFLSEETRRVVYPTTAGYTVEFGLCETSE